MIAYVASAVCFARSLISLATTAKPFPASPARAASMVALSASKLVCSEISVMVSVTFPICLAAIPSSSTFSDAEFASLTATFVISCAFSVLITMPLIF